MIEAPPSGRKPIPLMLQLPPDLEAVYANVARISHSPAELIFDFACMLPGKAPADVLTRLIMSPMGAKMFYRALGENLARYEAAFGEISIPGEHTLAGDLFRNIQPPEPPEKA